MLEKTKLRRRRKKHEREEKMREYTVTRDNYHRVNVYEAELITYRLDLHITFFCLKERYIE